jgi:hypothetical protein
MQAHPPFAHLIKHLVAYNFEFYWYNPKRCISFRNVLIDHKESKYNFGQGRNKVNSTRCQISLVGNLPAFFNTQTHSITNII